MKLGLLHGLTAVVCAMVAPACSGTDPGIDPPSGHQSTLADLERGAAVQRAYLGVTQDLAVGPRPVAGPFDLVGGAQIAIEVATRDGSPVHFELWQVHVDKQVTLASEIDSRSGFALQELHADEDSSWILLFPPSAPAHVVLRIDCTGGFHGCTPFLQPGDRCPLGWQCDEGLTCVVPGDTCEPVAHRL